MSRTGGIDARSPETGQSQDVIAEGEVLHTVEEISTRLRISRDTVYRLIETGALKALELSPRSIRVRDTDLQEYLRSRLTRTSSSDGQA